MAYEARRDGEFRNELSITLDTNEPTNNQVSALATVLFRKRHAPDPPKNVIFTLNDAEYVRVETEVEGRASALITLPGPGSYRLVAQLEGMPGVRVSRLLTVKETPKKSVKASKISVRVTGKCGEQKLFIYAVAEDGSLVAGAKILLLDGEKPSTFATDESGMFVYQTNFTGVRTFRVRIGENDMDNKQRAWKGVLQGK